MADLLLELFSEEIPARLQARAADDLARLLADALRPHGLVPAGTRTWSGPRRLALAADLPEATAATEEERRGPRADAAGPALEGFLRATGLPREALEERATPKGAWLYAVVRRPGRPVPEVLAAVLPGLLRRFPWPKAMRWGATSAFPWIRPLRRVACVFAGAPVPFALAEGDDDGHGIVAGDLTEGHRLHAPGAFAVRGPADWEAGLRARRVEPDAARREALIREGVAALAAAEGLEVVPDAGLLAEVAGLVEWPVPHLGRIDAAFMDLPPEVMRTTMRVNQRYFALRHPDGRAADRFALVANIAASDGGAALVAGNERVLRARLADARFFWDTDRAATLESRLPALDAISFHASLGSQGQRARRLARLARHLAPAVGADPDLAARAGLLAKADLVTGMVGEFPELQGVMGRYYALADGEDPAVAGAVGAHYRPLGPGDSVPEGPVATTVALADKLDQLAGFFAVGERPTGSGDPFALRRAALGVIRMVREGGLALDLADAVAETFFGYPQALGATAEPEFGLAVATAAGEAGWRPDPASSHPPMVAAFAAGVLGFLTERLRVQVRAEGGRADLFDAAAAAGGGAEADLGRLLARAAALAALLDGPDGPDLLAAHRRAANILRIESGRDGPHDGPVDPGLLAAPEEAALAAALDAAEPAAAAALGLGDFAGACAHLARLRAPLDAFFDRVTVNDADPQLRGNRLRLLSRLRSATDRVADFSKVEA